MEDIGGKADCVSGRAAVPGLSAALLHSAPASGHPAPAGTGTAVADTSSSDGGAAAWGHEPDVTSPPADDGARNAAEFLRTRLRISTGEARRRLALANATLPLTGLAGHPCRPKTKKPPQPSPPESSPPAPEPSSPPPWTKSATSPTPPRSPTWNTTSPKPRSKTTTTSSPRSPPLDRRPRPGRHRTHRRKPPPPLDIGRTTRVFLPHIRKALTARDQGCAFPNCTIPASWCEAHHITYWSQGGPTSTDNGVLLCTATTTSSTKNSGKSTSKTASPGLSRHPTSTRANKPDKTTTTKHEPGAVNSCPKRASAGLKHGSTRPQESGPGASGETKRAAAMRPASHCLP